MRTPFATFYGARLEQAQPAHREPSPRGQDRSAPEALCRPPSQRHEAQPGANAIRRRQRHGRRLCRSPCRRVKRGLGHRWGREEENNIFEEADARDWEEDVGMGAAATQRYRVKRGIRHDVLIENLCLRCLVDHRRLHQEFHMSKEAQYG